MHSVEYTKHALRALIAMPANTRALIKSKIEALAADPVNARNVKKLVGRPGYRLRVGDWRVIYAVDTGQLVVLALDIGARGGIYK
ncbi:MAG TPA: type II toxin-antitoxin system RelE/ParE family toxin [Ottowia sp.]|uniref:type II toxin-antitoxin system RelE family toxin n=1 Tax=Ottowia sp. TaxID=1898956 RepID=UPI002CEEF7D5|nr:type II toxin-antitoxin system RelE/ParE family toxin [Ottowia sp.]HMN19830.1 type II toxin-antitoxin system RelE/ParE family toxin [Ottowia sp.]